MDGLCGKNTRRKWLVMLVLLCCIIFQIWAVVGDVGQEMQGKPVITNFLKNLKKFHQNCGAKLKTLFHHAQLKFSPPNLDFRSRDGAGMGKGGAGEKVKEAAEKSFKDSKMTAQESAKTAAKVVEQTVHKARDKLSDDKSSHDHDDL